MRKIFYGIGLVALFSTTSFADDKPWGVDEIRARFQVMGEVFFLDAAGKRIHRKASEWSTWKDQFKQGKITAEWSVATQGNTVAFKHRWEVQDDGTIKASIEQYGQVVRHGADRDSELKNLVRKQDIVVENLEPITWVVSQNKTTAW